MTLTSLLRISAVLPLFAATLFISSTSLASENQLELMFIGDVVLDGAPGRLIAQGGDPFNGFDAILQQADVRIANLECVVASTGTAANKIFTFRAAPASLPTLKKHVDVVALANNHSGDYGPVAFAEMLKLLDQQAILHVGGGLNLAQAHTPLMIAKHGIRIAILSYNEFMPRSFEAGTETAGIAWSEDEQVVADIRAARARYHADLVLPFMHWGWENEPNASVRQQQLARLMIDAGADAVIGGHPHVTQGIDIYHGKPIIYSLGNFMIDALDNAQQTWGWVVRLKLNKQGVQSWHTIVAHLDQDGIPSPDLQVASPSSDKSH